MIPEMKVHGMAVLLLLACLGTIAAQQIRLEGAPALGDATAILTLVEFSDYQCPLSSQHFNWTMDQITQTYVKTGKLKYVYRDFPLEPLHPLAPKAAEGAWCAGEQGKYWEMHDRFFRNQMTIEPRILPL